MFYNKYKSEILTSLGVVVPLALVALGRYFTANIVLQHFTRNWHYYVIFTVLTYVVYQYVHMRQDPLSLYRKGGNPDFRATLDLGHSLYWYMGMGAEELLRDVNIEEYFVLRRNDNRPIKSLRFLFLNPESKFFTERLKEVDPNGDIHAISHAKKSYLKTLHFSLAALPPDLVQHYEIRYYDLKPIWLLQFFDTKAAQSGIIEPEGFILSLHIPCIHSRFSNQYICRKTNSKNMFDSFYIFFEAVWNSSIPATIVGELPPTSALSDVSEKSE